MKKQPHKLPLERYDPPVQVPRYQDLSEEAPVQVENVVTGTPQPPEENRSH